MPQRLVLAVSTEQERAVVTRALMTVPDADLAATVTDPEQLRAAVVTHAPDLVLLSSQLPGALGVVEQLTRQGVPVIVVLPAEDLALARRFLKAGAADVLPLALVPDELPESLQAVRRRGKQDLGTAPRQGQPGRIIVFYGPKGGVGSSLLATNVAVALAANLPPDSVCLVDLDLQFGAIPLLLNLQPKATLATLAQRFQGDLDFEFLQPFLLLHPDSNLRVLAAPSRPELAELVTNLLVERVLQVLRNHFAFTVVDTPTLLQDTSLTAMDAADHIFVVTALDLLAVRNAELVLNMFRKLYPPERIRLVINRANVHFGGLTAAQVEEHLKTPVVARIPSDGQLAVTSINEGVPFVLRAPQAPISQSIFALASLIAGQPIGASAAPSASSSLLRRVVNFLLGEE